jgi:alpha-glucosidase
MPKLANRTADRALPVGEREPGLGVGRDPSRTPMQWDASAFAGFSTQEPWLAAMRCDTTSILFLVRSLLHYRREHVALSQGQWRLLSGESDVLAYERGNGENGIIVVLNLTADPQVWTGPLLAKARVAISTHGDRCGESVGSTVSLRANEGLLIEQC